ncbi:wHTH domain-containing protein [Streptomyces sp. NPDC055037]
MSSSPESQDPEYLRLTRIPMGRETAWVKPDRQVSYGHVLYAAGTWECAPADVVSRLTALGFADIELPDGPLPLTVDPVDALLIKEEAYNLSWLGLGKPVSLRHVLAAAGRTGRSPAYAARRLTDFGYAVPAGHPLPETPDTRDIVLIRVSRGGNGDWLAWGAEVPAHHVLSAAAELGCSPHTAARRLAGLGIRLPYAPEPGDERILRYGTGHRAWAARYSSVPSGHILDVARETGRPQAAIVARLAELGCGVDAPVPDAPEADDFVLLSHELDGRAPWLPVNRAVGVQLRHILRASLVTGRTSADVTERLATLGHGLHAHAKVPAVADPEDIRLLETVDRSFLDNVHLEHVLRSASLTGRSPADVAARLKGLGYRLPDEVEYPEIRSAGTGTGAVAA